MHGIHEVRLFGNDLVERCHNSTDYLREFFAGATESKLRTFIESRFTLVDDGFTDAIVTLELSGVGETKPVAAPVAKAIHALDVARCQHRGVTACIASVLAMRADADELARRLGHSAAEFLAPGNDSHAFTGKYIDELLASQVEVLANTRRQCGARLAAKDVEIRDTMVALHEVRVVWLTMFCDHEGADASYVAALELRTGSQQPTPAPSRLQETLAVEPAHTRAPGGKKRSPAAIR